MLGKLIVPKYLDPGSPLVNLHIKNTLVHNTLIDLGATINTMTRDTMMKLNLQGFLRNTQTFLQLADRSIIKPEYMLEDIIISIDSWEYPTDFLVLQIKSQSNGYPLIFGRPWLTTTDAYNGCRVGNITITDVLSQKKIVLYPLPNLREQKKCLCGWKRKNNRQKKLPTPYTQFTLPCMIIQLMRTLSLEIFCKINIQKM
jgi:hypothetical protein